MKYANEFCLARVRDGKYLPSAEQYTTNSNLEKYIWRQTILFTSKSVADSLMQKSNSLEYVVLTAWARRFLNYFSWKVHSTRGEKCSIKSEISILA